MSYVERSIEWERVVEDLEAEIARLVRERDAVQAKAVRLTAELAESRAAYDAVCRHVGASLRRPMQHGADPDPLTLNGGAQ